MFGQNANHKYGACPDLWKCRHHNNQMYEALERFPCINVTFNNMSIDPTSVKVDYMTFGGRQNLETAVLRLILKCVKDETLR